MAEYIVKGESLTAIADKIRVLSGTEEAMGLDDMANNVGEANTDVATEADLIAQIVNALENKAVKVEFKEVEWSENENAIISGTISNYTNNMVTNIGNYAFYYCTNLTSVSFPVCTSIGSSAFYDCRNLTTANFPACTSIGNYAFAYCSKLTSVSFPVCTSIGSDAFKNCTALTTVSFPVCTSIGSDAFYYCTNLTSVSFPACTHISNYAFTYCSNLTSVSFPACTHISSAAFSKCYNLSQIYLTGSSLCTLQNSDAFISTPYAGYSASFSGTPYIYVPQSLLASYKTATNWTYFSSYFSGI